jgi:hypothetical protein
VMITYRKKIREVGMNATGAGNQLKGTGYKQVTTNNFTPEQTKLFQSMFSQLGGDSFLGNLSQGNPETFRQLEAPAMQQFNELQGTLASRFSQGGGAGSLGARRSSGFQNASNAAAQDFAGQLQAQRLGLQRQATQDLFGMQQALLNQRPFENLYVPEQKKSSFWEQLLGGLSGAAGTAAGNFGGLYGAKKFNLLG